MFSTFKFYAINALNRDGLVRWIESFSMLNRDDGKNVVVGRGGRFGSGASLYRHRLQLSEGLWVLLPLPTGQFSDI